MLEHTSSFSRARTLLQRANGNGGQSAQAGTGEADVFLHDWVARVEGSLAKGSHADVVGVERSPARSGTYGAFAPSIDPRIVDGLKRLGIDRPYLHQQRALDATLAGRDVVLATSTASGKSLCFQIPIVQSVLEDPSARALMLFPTKALGRDQVESMRRMVQGVVPHGVGAAVYDGDTPPDERRAARTRAHVVATNPDMLHRGVLPNHPRWGPFLAGLKTVVLDELHTYRGVFGSHVANVLRRLWRLCREYGSNPRIVACSATIANPTELAQAVSGRRSFVTVDEDTSPAGPRTFIVLNPKVVDQHTGVRRDFLKVTRAVVEQIRAEKISTLVFCRTRKAVELITRYLREDVAGPGSDAADRAAADRHVRGYRGGYLPELRREVEAALREGEARVVASTNALELGMDIGGLDAVVMAGYPGTRAATIQRAGRAGRRGQPALNVLVLSSQPLDQFVGASPGFLFGEPPEHARIDPYNPELLVPHLRCAAHELAFGAGEGFGTLPPDELAVALDYLADRRVLAAGPQGGYRSLEGGFPADDVDLRGTMEENFTVVDASDEGKVLAEVDFRDGPLYLHVGAIYSIEGRTHEVRRLDWDARKAFVHPVDAGYYTEAISRLRVRLVDRPEADPTSQDPGAGLTGTGYTHLLRAVPGFKKLRFRTHENIGHGPVNLPDLELHTQGAYWRVPPGSWEGIADPGARVRAALGAAYAIHQVAAMVLMCDVRDLGHAVTSGEPGGGWSEVVDLRAGLDDGAKAHLVGPPTLYLYDDIAGGAGLSAHAHELGPAFFDRVIAAVAGCPCGTGCPTCLGPDVSTEPDANPPGTGLPGSGEPAPAGRSDRSRVSTLLASLRDMVTPGGVPAAGSGVDGVGLGHAGARGAGP